MPSYSLNEDRLAQKGLEDWRTGTNRGTAAADTDTSTVLVSDLGQEVVDLI